RFRNCVRIVSQAAGRDRVIVVVSAMAGVTDLTFRAIDAARHHETEAVEAHLRKFEAVHRGLAGELFSGARLFAAPPLVGEISSRLESSVRAVLALGSGISAETTDSLVGLGERVSAWVFANYLQDLGSSAEFVRAEDAIVTDNNFGNAAPDMNATRELC